MTLTEPAASVVRILQGDRTAGTGFVVQVDRRLIVTCAHVVEFTGKGPGDDIEVVFHATGQRATAFVEPAYWRASDAQDVAFLRLYSGVADGVDAVPLGTSRASIGHPFRTFGFPKVKAVAGLAGTGTITDLNEVGQPRLQLSYASEVTVGFSGAPLFDLVARRVVGMVVEILAPDQGRLFETAFGVPSEALVAICDELRMGDLCPYRELNAFDENDAEFFLGRTDAVARLLSAIRHDPGFLAVLGPSGSGKSSLVRAGLLPHLREGGIPGSESWELMVTRPADLPTLDSEVPGIGLDTVAAARNWLDGHPDRTRLVLILDQFEEAFILLDDDTRARLLAGLGAAVESTAPVSVVLTMRDEFYSWFVREAPALARALERGLRNIPPELTRAELTDIVQSPATMVGLRFDDGLVSRIVNDAITLSPGREQDTTATTVLPMLELALTQLWEGGRDGVLTHAAYERIGRVTGGLKRWADRALDLLGEQSLPMARHVLTALVNLGDESQGAPDSRRRLPVTALARQQTEVTEINAVVRRLADERLVVTAEDTVELIHDALLREWGRLHNWLNEDRRFLRWKQELGRALTEWLQSGRDEGLLLHGHARQMAMEVQRDRALDITDDEHVYINESVAAWDRSQNRLRDALAEAEQQRAIAEERLIAASLREQAARVQALLPLDPIAGLTVAAAAMIRNLAELPAKLIAPVQVSLHRAIRLARERRRLAGHTAPVTCVAVPPNGRFFLTGSMDRTIRRWSMDGRPIGEPWVGHHDGVLAIALDHRGRFVFSAGNDSTVRKWTLDGQLVGEPWVGHTDAVTTIAVDPYDRYVMSGSADQTLRKWTFTGTPIGAPWTGHTDVVTSIAFNPDGLWVFSGGQDRIWRRWSTAGEMSAGQGHISPYPTHTDAITAIAANPHGGVISASADRTIRTWFLDGKPSGIPWVGPTAGINCLATDPNGEQVASAGDDKTVWLWDNLGRLTTEPFVGHQDSVDALAFTPDGRSLITGSVDRTVRMWDRQGQGPTAVLIGHSKDVNAVILLDNDRRIVSGSADGTLREWTVDGEPVGPPWEGHQGFVFDVVADPAGQRLLSASADGTVRMWEAATGIPLGDPFHVHDGPVHTVAFNHDGTLIASGGTDAMVRVFHPDGTSVHTFRGHEDEIHVVTFSPNGSLIASAGTDNTVRLWRPDGELTAGPLVGHDEEILDLAFAPDGQWFITASADRTLRRWASDGTPIGEPMHGHTGGVEAVRVSSDGRFIVSGSTDRTLRLWDSDGSPVSEPIEGHTAAVWSVAMGGDGRLLVSAGADGTIRTWQAGWRAWLQHATEVLAVHPGPGRDYAAATQIVRDAVDVQPWL